ncbi:udp-glucose:sterol glycosyltransferase [Niveomyces insectorum RCEF 264]|uniref:sterol 3beta-glucosyltransferase n=1 Tax=Niveomyces insectorum RCEF 264 TaxID=1081102 RepID=A0A167SNL3_9HYPO|nr:udp-glucose:sterol glycosyltransferase [Niveomyces insectorum RCEF 264]
MDFPERLKAFTGGGPEPDDEEVLRPNIPGSGVFMNLNQSIFGLIAAAGSTVNFNDRFEGHSSDDDDDDDDDIDEDNNEDTAGGKRAEGDGKGKTKDGRKSKSTSKRRSKGGDAGGDASDGRRGSRHRWPLPHDLAQSTIVPKQISSGSSESRRSSGSTKSGDRRSRLADSRLLRSLPSLKSRLSSKHRSLTSLSSRSSSKSAGVTTGGDDGDGGGGGGSSRIIEEEEEDEDEDQGGADTEGKATAATPSSLTPTPSSPQALRTPAQLPAQHPIPDEADADGDSSDGGRAPSSTSASAGFSSPRIEITRTKRADSMRSIAPVMSRMLEAEAELAAARPSFDFDRRSLDKFRGKGGKGSKGGKGGDGDDEDEVDAGGPSALARKLMEIFEFETPEEVIDECPCWLLQSVLLQGYMYITARHVCFYAYLPKKANEVAKSGYLAKSGKRNPKYNRFWFRLKGDVLAYYRDPSNLYFPHGQIDLRYGISATVTDKDKDKDGVHFQVVTHHRTYYFRADSAPSAKEWVKSLQRVIFRSHNDGDSVKISLPIANIIDIEETQAMVEFADTCKIRVIDNDETYAIDEYFFSFFDYGKEALRVLRILIDDASQQQQPTPPDGEAASGSQAAAEDAISRDSASIFGGGGVPRRSSSSAIRKGLQAAADAIPDDALRKPTRLHDSVRATLAPLSPIGAGAGSSPRASGELPRSSFDALRSSFGGGGTGCGSRRVSNEVGQALRGDSPRRSFSGHAHRSGSVGDRRRTGGFPPQSQLPSRSESPSPDRLPHQHADPQQQEQQGSTDSFVQSSTEDPSQVSFSNLVASASDDPSASRILHGSEVFQSPTVAHRSISAPRPHETRASAQVMASPTAETKRKRAVATAAATAAAAAGVPNAPRPHRPDHAATTGHMVHDPGAPERSGASLEALRQSGTTPASLQNLAKMGVYPLQRAGAYANWLNRQSRRMSSLLATESMGYVEKVSGMWKGGRQHYDGSTPSGFRTDDELDDDVGVSGPDLVASNERFRAHFALPSTERLQATYFGYLMRVLPLYGKIYISERSFCFRSLLPGTRTKLILPLKDIENVTKEKGFRFGFSGLVVVIRGHEELFFEFGQPDMRDDCAITLLQSLENSRVLKESGLLNDEEKAGAEAALAERDALHKAREETAPLSSSAASTGPAAPPAAAAAAATAATTSKDAAAIQRNKSVLRQTSALAETPTILFDDPKASFLNFKPPQPLRITCLTIGSRGDVQPYIALGKGLLAEGHHVRIATHPEFEGWIRGHGLDYGRVEGDPGELMRICIENGTFTWQFLREANAKMRTWLDELLASAWRACQDADLLIESPSAMAGIHIAERLQIPYFRAFTMPWTRTRAYPHAFIMPEHKMGGAYNYITYVMFDNIFWKATASQINRWRNKTLGLPNTTLEKMQPNKVPFLYNFSPSVVPPPLDYSDWIRVTGYWFLDEGTGGGSSSSSSSSSSSNGKENNKNSRKGNTETKSQAQAKTAAPKPPAWTPPKDLTDFIAKARRDGKKIVYVGFGSILVPDPAKMTQEVIDAVLKADVRCILSKGWSDRMVTAKEKALAAAAAAAAASAAAQSGEAGVGAPVATADDDNTKVEVPLPPEIFQIKSAPHDWLFAQIDAAAHHGGSGTTGASLRAGIPTIIRPFFGDQFFFGGRAEDLGVGICLKKWGAMSFARALWEATNSERMIKKAAALGRQIRDENGVDTAIQCIYRDMEYAKSLVKAKAGKNAPRSDGDDDEDDDEPEESWTFVGEDDPMQQSIILTADGGGSMGSNKALGSRVLSPAALSRIPMVRTDEPLV